MYSQQAVPDSHYQLISGKSIVQSKNYYLLTILEEDKEVRQLLQNDPMLSGITKSNCDNLERALKQCPNNAECIPDQLKFSNGEIDQISERLRKLYTDKRLSETDSEFYPLIEALQINPQEPIDP